MMKRCKTFDHDENCLKSGQNVVGRGWASGLNIKTEYLSCLDFFRGSEVNKVRLAGLEHVMCFTAVEGRVYLRVYM